MRTIGIVVDSGVDFPNPTTHKYVKVVPHTITFGSETFVDGIDMDTDAFFRYLSHDVPKPRLQAPSEEAFTEVYTELSRNTDRIISLHTTKTLSQSFENAKRAANGFMGRCEIAVLDSETTSIGLGLLTEVALKTTEVTQSLEDAIRVLRGVISRIYSIFYVDTLDYISANGLLGEAQAILGAMLNIKPFLTIEDGQLVTMEKVRTRSQAVDKLIEFVTEFEYVDRTVIMHNSPFTTEAVRMLQDRLNTEYGKRNYPSMIYGALLASYLGPDATGIVILESQLDTD